MEKNFKRNCPICNKELSYATKKSRNGAQKTNHPCSRCKSEIYQNKRKQEELLKYLQTTRNCPMCNKEIIYKTGKACHEAERENKKCISCAIKLAVAHIPKVDKECSECHKFKHKIKCFENENSVICKFCTTEIERKIEKNKIYSRNCDICNKEIIYSNKGHYNFYNSYKVIYCRSCKQSGERNPIHRKTSKNIRYSLLKNELTEEEFNIKIEQDKEIQRKAMKEKCSGKNNHMAGRTVYEVWVEKYGKEIADEKDRQMKAKQSTRTKGENNPMYGKTSPQGSGNGWSGKYKNIHFRSILELRYLKYLLDNNIPFENGEKSKYKIPYVLWDGTNRTYRTDYYLPNTNQFIELKPKKLISTPTNKLKFEAAKKLLGDRHIVLTEDDIQEFSIDDMYNLYTSGDLIWDKNYVEKFLNYYEKHKTS